MFTLLLWHSVKLYADAGSLNKKKKPQTCVLEWTKITLFVLKCCYGSAYGFIRWKFVVKWKEVACMQDKQEMAAKTTQNKYWNWKGSCRWHVKPGKNKESCFAACLSVITEMCSHCVLPGLGDPSDSDLALMMLLLRELLSLVGFVHRNIFFLFWKQSSTGLAWFHHR